MASRFAATASANRETIAAIPDSQLIEFSLPVVQLIVFGVLTIVVGILAAIFPARRAARLDPLELCLRGLELLLRNQHVVGLVGVLRRHELPALGHPAAERRCGLGGQAIKREVKGIEGVPEGNLDKYVFPPNDPAYEALDPRALESGAGVWVKPAKFLSSVGIFALTMAWLAGYVRPERRRSRPVRSRR